MNADDEKKLNQIASSFYYDGKATADRVDAAVRAAYALGRRAGMTDDDRVTLALAAAVVKVRDA